MELIHGMPMQTFVRAPYEKWGGPPMDDGEGPGGPGGPGGPDGGMPEEKPSFAALEIVDGKIAAHNEALAGEVNEKLAKNVRMDLNRSDMGGVYVSGSEYSVEHANIRISGEGQGLDDFTTQPAGNAGRKIACGRICACG